MRGEVFKIRIDCFGSYAYIYWFCNFCPISLKECISHPHFCSLVSTMHMKICIREQHCFHHTCRWERHCSCLAKCARILKIAMDFFFLLQEISVWSFTFFWMQIWINSNICMASGNILFWAILVWVSRFLIWF